MSYALRAKRVLIGALAGAMVLSLLPAGAASADIEAVCEGAPDASFTDAGDTHADNINCMAGYGVAQGIGGGLFGTAATLTRGQAATLFVNFAVTATDGAIADDVDEDIDVPFTDIEGTTHEANIETLFRLDLISGTTDTTYSPSATISRDQFATILFNAHVALGVEFEDEYTTTFTDIEGNTHEESIRALAGEGIISGTTATTFGPGASVLRGQTATLLTASAGVLEDSNLWTSARPWVPTNQTFSVEPSDLALSSATDGGDATLGSREFTVAGLDEVDEVIIVLAEAGNVEVSNGTVSFEEDDGAADFGAVNATLGSVTIDGTTFTGIDAGDDINVEDVDSISFEINASNGEVESVVPVVYVGTGDDDDELAVDDDGVPADDAEFGIGGATAFVIPALTFDGDLATDVLVADPLEVEIQVLDEIGGDPLEVAGIEIDVRFATDDAANFGEVTLDKLFDEQTVTTNDEGVATYVADGSDLDDDTDTQIFVQWEGAGALAGLAATEASPVITFYDEVGDPAAVVGATTTELLGVGMTASVTATVTDGQGLRVPGAVVRLSGDAAERSDFTQTATTNADGVATFTYANNVGVDIDELTVEVIEDADGDAVAGVEDGDFALVGWFAEANSDNDQVVPLTEADVTQNVIGASADLQVVFIGTVETAVADGDDVQARLVKLSNGGGIVETDDMLWVSYTDGDTLQVDGSAVDDVAAFEAALFDDDGFDQDALLFEAQDRDDDDADTIYNLITEAIDTESDFLLSSIINDGNTTVAATTDDPSVVTVTAQNVFEDALTGFVEGDFEVTVDGNDATIAEFVRAAGVYNLTTDQDGSGGVPVVVTVDGVELTSVDTA